MLLLQPWAQALSPASGVQAQTGHALRKGITAGLLLLQPLAQAASAQFSGAIAVGRQVTATPLLYTRRMQVGCHRRTEIGVTVKGSRALVKVYTDVQLNVDQAQACYSSGLEPTIAMVCLLHLQPDVPPVLPSDSHHVSTCISYYCGCLLVGADVASICGALLCSPGLAVTIRVLNLA